MKKMYFLLLFLFNVGTLKPIITKIDVWIDAKGHIVGCFSDIHSKPFKKTKESDDQNQRQFELVKEQIRDIGTVARRFNAAILAENKPEDASIFCNNILDLTGNETCKVQSTSRTFPIYQYTRCHSVLSNLNEKTTMTTVKSLEFRDPTIDLYDSKPMWSLARGKIVNAIYSDGADKKLENFLTLIEDCTIKVKTYNDGEFLNNYYTTTINALHKVIEHCESDYKQKIEFCCKPQYVSILKNNRFYAYFKEKYNNNLNAEPYAEISRFLDIQKTYIRALENLENRFLDIEFLHALKEQQNKRENTLICSGKTHIASINKILPDLGYIKIATIHGKEESLFHRNVTCYFQGGDIENRNIPRIDLFFQNLEKNQAIQELSIPSLLWIFRLQENKNEPIELPGGSRELFLQLPKDIREYYYYRNIALGGNILPYLDDNKSQEDDALCSYVSGVHYIPGQKYLDNEEKTRRFNAMLAHKRKQKEARLQLKASKRLVKKHKIDNNNNNKTNNKWRIS